MFFPHEPYTILVFAKKVTEIVKKLKESKMMEIVFFVVTVLFLIGCVWLFSKILEEIL